MGLILTAGIFFFLGRWSLDWSRSGSEPNTAFERVGPVLDLNRATRAELRLLHGVGDGLAQRIIAHRDRHGPFRSVDDLRQVGGIGPKTLDRLRPWLFVAEEAPVVFDEESDWNPRPSKQPSPVRSSMVSTSKREQPTGLISINHASQDELRKLPGIGPKLSQRILDTRAKSPFKSIEELRRVPGIGPKTLEKLRPHVTVDGANTSDSK
jgi:competence protein ComEA